MAILSLASTLVVEALSRRRVFDSVGLLLEDVRKQMVECHSHALATNSMSHKKIIEFAEERHVRTVIERDGLERWLLDPTERVAMEMRAYEEELGLTKEQTIAWIRDCAEKGRNRSIVNGSENP